jgi:hypothetical protein
MALKDHSGFKYVHGSWWYVLVWIFIKKPQHYTHGFESIHGNRLPSLFFNQIASILYVPSCINISVDFKYIN